MKFFQTKRFIQRSFLLVDLSHINFIILVALKKPNKIALEYFRLKCPVCNKGEFLQTQPLFFFKLIRVRESYTNCKTRFKIEPAFTMVYECFLSFRGIPNDGNYFNLLAVK